MIIINKEVLKSTAPCVERWKNYLEHYCEFNGPFDDFLNLDKISYDDKIWVAKKVLNINQLVHFAILCAESVLNIYEIKYPNDKRISNYLVFIKTIVDFNSMTNEQRGKLRELRGGVWQARNYAAADAADAAVYAADAADAAGYAGYAADADAANAVAAGYAAAVADAIAAGHTAAVAAGYAAAFAADAVIAAARTDQQNLNLQFLKMAVSL